MAGSSADRRCGGMHALKNVLAIAACGSVMASCASASYQTEAMHASEGGDQKAAISLARKEVARFSGPDQCSRAISLNCGTLALAYGTLAGYQILDGDRIAGEGSFSSAKGALGLTDAGTRSSATAVVYRDVSVAFWQVGDRARAVSIFNEGRAAFNEGRAAGADKWLFMSSAARVAAQQPTDQRSTDSH